MLFAIICSQESNNKNDTDGQNLPGKITVRTGHHPILNFFLMQVCLNSFLAVSPAGQVFWPGSLRNIERIQPGAMSSALLQSFGEV